MLVATTIYRASCTVCEKIANIFKSLFDSWVAARQMQANYYVAQQLKQSGEYKDETLSSLLYKLNNGGLPARNSKV